MHTVRYGVHAVTGFIRFASLQNYIQFAPRRVIK